MPRNGDPYEFLSCRDRSVKCNANMEAMNNEWGDLILDFRTRRAEGNNVSNCPPFATSTILFPHYLLYSILRASVYRALIRILAKTCESSGTDANNYLMSDGNARLIY